MNGMCVYIIYIIMWSKLKVEIYIRQEPAKVTTSTDIGSPGPAFFSLRTLSGCRRFSLDEYYLLYTSTKSLSFRHSSKKPPPTLITSISTGISNLSCARRTFYPHHQHQPLHYFSISEASAYYSHSASPFNHWHLAYNINLAIIATLLIDHLDTNLSLIHI